MLFDSGANHSFISPTFVRCLWVKPKRLDHALEVEMTNNRCVSIRDVVEGCTIDVEGIFVPMLLYPMSMRSLI